MSDGYLERFVEMARIQAAANRAALEALHQDAVEKAMEDVLAGFDRTLKDAAPRRRWWQR